MTVGELRQILKDSGQSPEQLAKQVNVSNMTIRRLLKKRDSDSIPSKYVANFYQFQAQNVALAPTDLNPEFKSNDFENVLQNLTKSGSEIADPEQLKNQVSEKIEDPRIKGDFLSKIKLVTKLAFGKSTPKLARILALGSLAYLVNPFDLIPDALPGGYLDDMAILTVVITYLVSKGKIPSQKKS